VNTAAIRDSGFGNRIKEAGDSALLLELEAVIDPDVNACAVAIASAVAARRLPGVRDIVPTFHSVAVHFDPLATDVDAVRTALSDAARAPAVATTGSLVEVPVAYGGHDGPDLGDVAAFAGTTEQVVIDRHTASEYRVFMLGFMPGFAYMGSVDESIAAPRRPTPRTRVPAGSVGIAGRQTGVYPRPSPGGWQLIGRTALCVFDAERTPPSLFAAGDRVRFVATRGDRGVGIEDRKSTSRDEPRTHGSQIPDPRSRQITIIRPGLFTTIQDLGRWGHQSRGVPVAGPMDAASHRLANALIGNPHDAATLEATVLGPEIRMEHATAVVVTGADHSASIDSVALPLNTPRRCAPGSVLRFGEPRTGTRAYIAFDGGIDVSPTLGSRATHVVSGLGGVDGRALKAGDRVGLGRARSDASPRREPFRVASPAIGGARLRVMRGPQDDRVEVGVLEELQRTRFTISPQSDRMGYRLIGGPHTTGGSKRIRPPGDMISDAAFVGGIQIPPSGDPILLMADRQTTGGYPQIATVITADLPKAGQLAPGNWIEFAFCTRREATAALREQEDALRAI
jgi:KipI family sensor histidine kinase inhibitor